MPYKLTLIVIFSRLPTLIFAQTALISEANGLFAVKWSGTARLTGGIGSIQNKPGVLLVQKVIRNGVAVSWP